MEINYNFNRFYSIVKLTCSYTLELRLEAQEGYYRINYLFVIAYSQINTP